ncbi:MAG: S8 family serine peptidase, partial [Phycisphaerales bacterium]|nr:S8 family serine peptidase [Phycisphaerales bacterium]
MSSVLKVFVCLAVVFGSHALAADQDPSLAPMPVDSVRTSIEPIAKWDATSPQELVRIEGRLYQREHGFFFRVIDDHVTVRLSEQVSSWPDLVEKAIAADPVHAALADLVPVRRNRLNIVDLQIPSGEPHDWGAMIHATGLARYAEVATYGSYTVVPNDSSYGQQWALNNTGQTGGIAGADISAEEAWEIATGDPSIVVGILDSGTLFTHPDLAANMWNNEDEIPGNSIDDDNNGFIDDTVGWDFPNNNNNPSSNNFHGTHVAGIVLAVTDNGLGIAGVAGGMDGSPGAQGLIVEVGSSFPVGSIMDDAVLYAADNGAHGITLSLTVGSSSALDDALDEAYDVQDVFINNASGNNGSSVGYPATHPKVMAVASSTDTDAKSGFSNPGPQVEVAAPGSDILSTQLGNGYGLSSGTSFASPHVAGLAALIRGHNSALSAPEVRQIIIDTADDISTPGFDNGTGWGRINAHEALLAAGSSAGAIELDADVYACSGTVGVQVMDFDLAGLGAFNITVTSGTESAGELVLMTESGTGTFTGS